MTDESKVDGLTIRRATPSDRAETPASRQAEDGTAQTAGAITWGTARKILAALIVMTPRMARQYHG